MNVSVAAGEVVVQAIGGHAGLLLEAKLLCVQQIMAALPLLAVPPLTRLRYGCEFWIDWHRIGLGLTRLRSLLFKVSATP